jgi:hypothetical protein
MTDVANLRINSDSSDVRATTADIDRLAAAGLSAEAQLDASIKAMSNDFKLLKTEAAGLSFRGPTSNVRRFSNLLGGLGRVSGETRFKIRNLGFQLNQFVQQGFVTGNYIQALAIQLPDIFQSLGTIGIFAGLAAGALAPLAISFIRSRDASEQFKNASQAVETALEQLDDKLRTVNLSSEAFAERFGVASEPIRQLAQFALDVELGRQRREVQETVNALTELSAQYGETTRVVDEFGETITQEVSVRKLLEDLEISGDAANALSDAFVELNEAQGLDAIIAAVLKLKKEIEDNNIETEQFPIEVLKGIDAVAELTLKASELEQRFSDAARAAGRIPEALANADRSPSSFRGTNNPQRGGRGSVIPTAEDARLAGMITASGTLLTAQQKEERQSKKLSGSQKEHNRLLREAQQIYERNRTAIEVFNDEVARLNELQEAGVLIGDSYTREYERLADELEEAQNRMTQLDQAVVDGFTDIAANVRNASDAVAAFINQLGTMALSTGFQLLFGGLSSALGPGISSIFGVQPRAMGGPVGAGSPYLVGERGPELFVPSNNGSIIPNDQMGSYGATSVNLSINMLESNDVNRQIEELKAQIPALVIQTIDKSRRRNSSVVA